MFLLPYLIPASCLGLRDSRIPPVCVGRLVRAPEFEPSFGCFVCVWSLGVGITI